MASAPSRRRVTFRYGRAAAIVLALLAQPALAAGPVCDGLWRDAVRLRDLPVRVRLPDGTGRVPVVLFSPGFGAGIDSGGGWAAAWVAAGLAVVQLQHPGSDGAAYAGAVTPEARAARVRAALTPVQLFARAGDLRFVMDELARRPREGACDLARLDLDRIGVAGHSMGAWAVQLIAGEALATGEPPVDRRPRAFVTLSSSAAGDLPPPQAFGGIRRPLLSVTGSLDGAMPGMDAGLRAAAVAQRTAPWAAMPADGRKYLLVVDGGSHMMFAGNGTRAGADAAAARVLAVGGAVTTAFWRRWLLDDKAADAVLARPPVGPADRWQRK